MSLGKISTKSVFKAFLSDFQTCLRHFSERFPTQIFEAVHVCYKFVNFLKPEHFNPGDKLKFADLKPGLSDSDGIIEEHTTVCNRFNLPAGNYMLIPSTFDPEVEKKFGFKVFADRSIVINILI